ncbi:MAG: hypothetical protein ACXWW9_01870 [Actinomycetota bacterium]
MEFVGYVAAAAVVVFGIYVLRRLILSWRHTYRGEADDEDRNPVERRSGEGNADDTGTPSG